MPPRGYSGGWDRVRPVSRSCLGGWVSLIPLPLLLAVSIPSSAGAATATATDSPGSSPVTAVASLKGSDLLLLLPAWNGFYDVSAGAGYNDNLLLGSTARQQSGFGILRANTALWRRPVEDGQEFLLTLAATDRRYWAPRDMDHDDALQLQARYTRQFGPRWALALEADGFYSDQILDTSSIDTPGVRQRIHGGRLDGLPGIRWKSGESTPWVELAPIVSQTWLRAPYDSFSEHGMRLSTGRPYGWRSEWRLDYSLRFRDYESHPAVTSGGLALPGTHLGTLRHEVQWVDRHYWDEARRWFTTTKLRGRFATDNASGFYDSRNLAVAEQLNLRTSRWELALEAEYGRWDFPHQPVPAAGGGAHRGLDDWVLVARVERRVGLSWKLFLEYERESVRAADPFDGFLANVYTLGVTREF